MRSMLHGLLVAVLAAMAVAATVRTWREAGERGAIQAADALPVYLAGAAVLDGLDPTSQTDLQQAYERRDLKVRASTFSNLYPASTGVLVQVLADRPWPDFIALWRVLLLAGGLVGGLAAGLAGARGRGRWPAAALGLWLVAGGLPVTAECVALGQINILLAGLMGLAVLGLARGWGGLVGTAAALGAALKLVPAIVAWPLVGGRRWPGLIWAAGAGLALAGLTALYLPLPQVVEGVRGTLQFQSTINPTWLTRDPAAAWMLPLGALRHTPLAAWTVALAGACAWASERGPAQGPVLAGGAALATAWLGADAAAFHVLYAPLYIPAMAWVGAWVLDEDAPWQAWPVAATAAAPALLYAWDLPQVPIEARMVLAGLVLWASTAARLLWHTGRALRPLSVPAPIWGVLGGVAGWGMAYADVWDERPHGPAPEQVGDITGYGLPEGVGHGGPRPGGEQPTVADVPLRSPDSVDAVPLYQVLQPKACGRLTSHLFQAPGKWRTVDHELASWLADHAPPGPCAETAFADAALYLALERYAVRGGVGSGAPPEVELQRTLAAIEAGNAPR